MKEQIYKCKKKIFNAYWKRHTIKKRDEKKNIGEKEIKEGELRKEKQKSWEKKKIKRRSWENSFFQNYIHTLRSC